jgi:hypothetical protein
VFLTVTPTPPDLMVNMQPINPPIIIPELGGSFGFTVNLKNNTSIAQACTVWTVERIEHGPWSPPLIGPVILSLPGNVLITRVRTQQVAASTPHGIYLYQGRVGNYVNNIIRNWHEFPFCKLPPLNDYREAHSFELANWICTGEPFPGEILTNAAGAPTEFALLKAYPNPFNPCTTLRYKIPDASQVYLWVYDTAGRLVTTLVDGWRDIGEHQVTFDGSNLASGVYLYKLSAGQRQATGKMVLMK